MESLPLPIDLKSEEVILDLQTHPTDTGERLLLLRFTNGFILTRIFFPALSGCHYVQQLKWRRYTGIVIPLTDVWTFVTMLYKLSTYTRPVVAGSVPLFQHVFTRPSVEMTQRCIIAGIRKSPTSKGFEYENLREWKYSDISGTWIPTKLQVSWIRGKGEDSDIARQLIKAIHDVYDYTCLDNKDLELITGKAYEHSHKISDVFGIGSNSTKS